MTVNSAEQVIPRDVIKEDTISAVQRRSNLLNASLELLEPEKQDELMEELTRTTTGPNLDHPFGHYKIPTLTPDLKTQIQAPVGIKFVPITDKAFEPKPGKPRPLAVYSPTDDTVYLNEQHFTAPNRITSWIVGLEGGSGMNEELIEHEIRHGLFYLHVPEPHGGGIANIAEGYANATKYQPLINRPFFSRLLFHHYDVNYLEPAEIGEYLNLFKTAQAKAVDDVKLLQYMEEHDWWANLYGDWYLDSKRVQANVFKHIGAEGIDDVVRQYRQLRKEELLDFRYSTWQTVHQHLKKSGLEFENDWDMAIHEEQIIREDWKRMK